jgi:hypothetical protein
MALRRHHQGELATVARPSLDLIEQLRRRLGAVGDYEQSPGLRLVLGHGGIDARAGAQGIIRIE